MWSALRARNFRLLWLSQTVSTLGDALVIVMVGLYVTRLTGDPFDVGMVLCGYSLPLILFLQIGGVVGDRLSRRNVMVVCDLTRGVLHGLLAVLIATGAVQVWQMVTIAVCFGTADAFFRPAYTGLVPQTVQPQQIQSAQALGGLSRELATFASPALATALVLSGGAAAAFAMDAVSFGLSAVLLLRMERRSTDMSPARTPLRQELAVGWKAVASRPWVWATIAAFAVGQLLALAPFLVLGAQVATQLYGSDGVYGWASTAWGAGTVCGVAAASRWRPHRPMRAALLASAPWPTCITIFALQSPLAVVYAAMCLAGLGVGLFTVWWETALAERIPSHELSRVSAWEWLGMTAILPVGYLLVGPITAQVGDVTLLAAGGIIGTIAASLALLPPSTRALTRTLHLEHSSDRNPRAETGLHHLPSGHRHDDTWSSNTTAADPATRAADLDYPPASTKFQMRTPTPLLRHGKRRQGPEDAS